MSERRKTGSGAKVERQLARMVFDRHEDQADWFDFPSVPVLAARFGVSVSTVREVLHGYVALGIVKSERGRFVAAPVNLAEGAQTVALRLRCAASRSEHEHAQHAWFALLRTTVRAALPLAVVGDHALRSELARAGSSLSATWGLGLTRPSQKVYALFDFVWWACETSNDRGLKQLARTLWDGLEDVLPFAGQVAPLKQLDAFSNLFEEEFPLRRHQRLTDRFDRVLEAWEESTTTFTRENDDPRETRPDDWNAIQYDTPST